MCKAILQEKLHSYLLDLGTNFSLSLHLHPFVECASSKGSSETAPGADPGFLERGFVCIKVRGVHFADFISLFLNIP